MKEGDGEASLCSFGATITPNQHQLARDFQLMDNYYVAGKCSAEGHQWTDAGMVTDYIEKNVGAWYRSYPHVQYDALVYGANGFIWNHALSYGKSVRIYGEACRATYQKKDLITQFQDPEQRKAFAFTNVSTIAGVRPILSQNYPAGDDLPISDQYRADGFIKELNEYENMAGDQLPQLMVMALSNDHTLGTRPGAPTPNAMVADNDLALGRIIEALSHSRFWKETVIFVTEDDSQAGWDHVSA
ncbi:alkaline phosphatase family protein [Pinibacter soli]|uniref:Alkaline phosphatase family protein n=1 Tax=Pinibacter soli TaxID=3044211 RepID=A0ABT6RAJ3_9BACT|nr:alkaline phosphatase family protein [Pinibacter soli]MDI3319425.1 alkaline phosphatase family protein [Pinibacter soli]